MNKPPFKAIEQNCENRTPPTNADRIRAMSDEELAVWVVGIHPEDCPFGPYDYGCIRTDCDGCWLDWLRSPVEV